MKKLTPAQKRLIDAMENGYLTVTMGGIYKYHSGGYRPSTVRESVVRAVLENCDTRYLYCQSPRFKVPATVIILRGKEHLIEDRYSIISEREKR